MLLKKYHSIDTASPRKVFQECRSQNILTEQEVTILLEMIDARNEASHIYDETKAEAISKNINHYCQTLAEVIKKIEAHIEQ